MKLKGMIICAFIFPGIFFCTQSFATDELYLCGNIQEINTKDALLIVDVTSKSCRGPQKLKLSAAAKSKASFNVGERKCFFINSSRCNPGYLYTITKTVSE